MQGSRLQHAAASLASAPVAGLVAIAFVTVTNYFFFNRDFYGFGLFAVTLTVFVLVGWLAALPIVLARMKANARARRKMTAALFCLGPALLLAWLIYLAATTELGAQAFFFWLPVVFASVISALATWLYLLAERHLFSR